MIPARLTGYGAWPNTSSTRSCLIYSARVSLGKCLAACRRRGLPCPGLNASLGSGSRKPFRDLASNGDTLMTRWNDHGAVTRASMHRKLRKCAGEPVMPGSLVAEKPVARTANILVVDDVSANLQVLTGMLKDRGYKARPVPNGKLALLAARKEPPDLILLDINMPEMNGYEVCQQLKADRAVSREFPSSSSAPSMRTWTK